MSTGFKCTELSLALEYFLHELNKVYNIIMYISDSLELTDEDTEDELQESSGDEWENETAGTISFM